LQEIIILTDVYTAIIFIEKRLNSHSLKRCSIIYF
jgi:hypothetical protein